MKKHILLSLFVIMAVLLIGCTQESGTAKEASKEEAVITTPAPQTLATTPEAEAINWTENLDEANQSITISHDTFGKWYTELTSNPEKYQGYTIIIPGSVIRNTKTPNDNEFIVSRELLSCCIEDMTQSGFVCEYDQAKDITDGEWVTVTGKLDTGEYLGIKEPKIVVSEVGPAEEANSYAIP